MYESLFHLSNEIGTLHSLIEFTGVKKNAAITIILISFLKLLLHKIWRLQIRYLIALGLRLILGI